MNVMSLEESVIRHWILYITKRYREAIPSINKAIELDPNNLGFKKTRAMVYLLQSDPKKALHGA